MDSKKELDEKDFIPKKKNSKAIWIFLLLMLATLLFFWLFSMWQGRKREEAVFSLTQREYSLFLHQNPQEERVESRRGDKKVSISREVFFRFHLWSRLLKEESLASRPIHKDEFLIFLKENGQWLPKNWKGAPKEYGHFVKHLKSGGREDLQNELPFSVRLAFQGWKNDTQEQEEIQQVQPTKGEIAEFLKLHPHYNHPCWFNILKEEKPDYLKSFLYGPSVIIGSPDERISDTELTSFFKVGIYNWQRAQTASVSR